MSGMNDNAGGYGGWMPMSPNTQAFGSLPLLGSDCDKQLYPEETFIEDTEEPRPSDDTMKNNVSHWGMYGMELPEGSLFSEQRSSRGGLVERLAARAGFNAPRLNTESFRSSGLSINSDVRSPYLTIPPGISPTTLLESPILLTDARAHSSPTTGQFPFVPNDNRGSLLMSEAFGNGKDNLFEGMNSSTFAFKPAADSGVMYLDQTNKTHSASLPHQTFPSTESSVQADNKSQPSETTLDMFQWSNQNINRIHTVAGDKGALDAAGRCAGKSPSLEEQQDDGDQKGNGDSGVPVGGAAPCDDGFNWRKYGQKQVKGSEYPRSYYKCTSPNCPVKKKVERSLEGHITEIIYKGNHNHPKPPPNRRTAGSSSNLQLDYPEQGRQHSGDPSWGNMLMENTSANPEMGSEYIEVTSRATNDSEFCNPTSSLQPHNGKRTEPGDAVDLSSAFSNDEDDVGTHGSVSLTYDGEGDESESKRRKVEASAADVTGNSRVSREPRVVVQTTSDVDILDDGYRWRKYGQKVVKGNPNPRSYYKCTSPGCTVRKHVERASNDPKSVITTYEGKHNHEVPAARNSTHVSSSIAAQMNQAAASAAQSNNVRRSEPSQVQNGMARFERPPSYNSFGLSGRPHLNPSPGFSFGMNQGLSNMHMPGLGSGQSNMPFLPGHPFLSQPPMMNDMGFMLPREPKQEYVPEPGQNLSPSSAMYQQLVGRLPLGPQM